MAKKIELTSDTVTRPSAAMRQAIAQAEVGNEQEIGGDPTTLLLEQKVAELLGFSSALFFPSATMANQVALRLHCAPGEVLYAADSAHLFLYEAGGPAINASVLAHPLPTQNGIFLAQTLRNAYRPIESPHSPIPRLVSVENPTNQGGGVAWPMETLKGVVQTAKELSLKLHLDGSRLFNAVTTLGVSAAEICRGFDTVTLCLSKGLGCPVGAVLAFDAPLFSKVRRHKQIMGGALRQSGILAAAGLYALDNNISRLHVDHENAKRFAEGLTAVPNIQVENRVPSTNMVFFLWKGNAFTAEEFSQKCQAAGVSFSKVGPLRFRAVTHLDISTEDIDRALTIVKEIAEGRS